MQISPRGAITNGLDAQWMNDLHTFSAEHNLSIRKSLRRLADAVDGSLYRINNDLNGAIALNNRQDGYLKDHNTRLVGLANKNDAQDNYLKEHNSRLVALSNKNDAQDNYLKDHNLRIIANANKNDAQDGYLKSHSANLVALNASVLTINDKNNAQDGYLKDHDARLKALASVNDRQDGYLKEHASSLVNLTNNITNINKKNDAQDGYLKDHASTLVSHSNIQKDLQRQIDNLALGGSGVIELTSVVTAITLAAKDNSDLWNAEHYDGGTVGTKDGRAVRLFKVQFQELKTLISSMFSNYFSLTDANSTASKIKLSIENAPKKTESLLNSMYVTMNNRFNRIIELLEGILAKEGGAPGSNGEVFARLDSIISSLDRIIEILTQILSKEIKVDIPHVTVNVPEVTLSESGNGWLRTLIETIGDVMKTAITSMADVLKTAIEELGKSLGKVLDFLDGLMDWVIKLVVPENLDFMESKFDSTSKTIKCKFPFIFDWVDIFKGMFGGQEAIPDIQMSMGSFFGEEKVNLPLSYFNEIAPNVRIFVTGFILLGFLIDMYKWFHTRGEVLE